MWQPNHSSFLNSKHLCEIPTGSLRTEASNIGGYIKLEGHSVKRINLRQRSSDGSVNKTILKPRLALAPRRQYVYVGFSRHKIPRISAARWQV